MFLYCIYYKMDLYGVSDSVSYGNQVGTGRDDNRFLQSQNALLIGNATNALNTARESEKEGIGEKSATDTVTAVELPGTISGVVKTSQEEGLAAKSLSNIRSGAGSLSRALTSTPSAADRVAAVPKSFKIVGDAEPVLKPADIGLTSAESSEGMAEGLSATSKTFDSVADAGGVSKFLLNKTLGITSDLGLEMGSKAVGGLGGAISAEGDISNLLTTGHIFKPHESFLSEAGNIGSMAGAALDMASIALPVLAPLAIGVNIASALAGTVGEVQDDAGTVSKDETDQTAREAGTNTLAIHPAWSSVGMVASVHSQPSIN